MRTHLIKSAPVNKFVPNGDQVRRISHVKFRPATEAELKAMGMEGAPDGFIAGWASTKDMDLYRHRVMPNAFAEAIQTRGLQGPKGIKLLLDHDWRKPAGAITKLEYRNGDLWIEGQLNLEISYVKDRYLAAKSQGGLSFSVGFMLEKYAVEGDEAEGGEWLRIDKGDLYEVSVVLFPANEEATMPFIKSQSDEDAVELATVAEVEKLFVAEGIVLSRNQAKRLTQVVKANIGLFHKGDGSNPASVPPSPTNPPVLAAESVQKFRDALAGLSALAEKLNQN
jgi:HK97 family phage prohead protease